MLYLLDFMRSFSSSRDLKPEEAICVQFAAYMREMSITGRCRHVWFHVSNEGSSKGKALWGMRQRNMGKFSGVADYVFLGDPCLALEIKNGNKRLQDSQETFKRWCGDCGVIFRLASSYQEAVDIVKELGIVTVSN